VLSNEDLAILAADETRYAEYVAGVRAEYAHLTEAQFNRGRLAILQDLIRRPHLFQTSHARTHWENAARTNLAKEHASRRDT
jgi:predicted metal-dependent HD superfamily phosphohydrolase